MGEFRDVDPGLPSGRQDGPDPRRYADQVMRFGARTDGKPPLEVTEDGASRLRINNGVTRAVRVHRLSPGTTVSVEIIEVSARANFSRLKRVRDLGSS